ncbi:uncharacterized protein IUM83_09025 [Phytophthora cinnamomi]|uniref:uncharacterized protein n=1 Tax=Phytophthora cinnamomi TaxID=4785 RepID=UPI003559B495|nr:hypothetical protein IUM83_09025 [Phytophthora cinnamomi]
MKKIIFSIISFVFFAIVMFLHIPTSRMHYQHHGISAALSTSGGDSSTDNSFFEIETIPDIFNWLNDIFIPQIFVSTDYNGDTLSEQQKGRIAAFNKVLGAVHFEVTSMEETPCDTPAFLTNIYSSCYDSSRTTTDNLLIGLDTNASYALAILNAKKEVELGSIYQHSD